MPRISLLAFPMPPSPFKNSPNVHALDLRGTLTTWACETIRTGVKVYFFSQQWTCSFLSSGTAAFSAVALQLSQQWNCSFLDDSIIRVTLHKSRNPAYITMAPIAVTFLGFHHPAYRHLAKSKNGKPRKLRLMIQPSCHYIPAIVHSLNRARAWPRTIGNT